MAFLAGSYEWLVILIIALLLFGRRLPEVMRSMGKGVMEFKKGLRDIEDDIAASGEDTPQIDKQKRSEGSEDEDRANDQT